jgi:ABC-type amino acid transport system permease subunit
MDHFRLHSRLNSDRHRGGRGLVLRAAVAVLVAAADFAQLSRAFPLHTAFGADPVGLLCAADVAGHFHIQHHGGAAIGMSSVQSMRYIIMPQAIKNMLPAFINQSVIQLKNTSLLYAISIAELTYMTSVVTSESYRPLEAYSLAAVLYFAMLFPLTQIADHFERRMRRSD